MGASKRKSSVEEDEEDEYEALEEDELESGTDSDGSLEEDAAQQDDPHPRNHVNTPEASEERSTESAGHVSPTMLSPSPVTSWVF